MKKILFLCLTALPLAGISHRAVADSTVTGDVQNDNDDESVNGPADDAAYRKSHLKQHAIVQYIETHAKTNQVNPSGMAGEAFGFTYLPVNSVEAAEAFINKHGSEPETAGDRPFRIHADGACSTVSWEGHYTQKYCEGDKFQFNGSDYTVVAPPHSKALIIQGIIFVTDKFHAAPVMLLRDQNGKILLTTTTWMAKVKTVLDTSVVSTKGYAGDQCHGAFIFNKPNKRANGQKAVALAVAQAKGECEALGKSLDESSVKTLVKNDANCFEVGSYWSNASLDAKCK